MRVTHGEEETRGGHTGPPGAGGVLPRAGVNYTGTSTPADPSSGTRRIHALLRVSVTLPSQAHTQCVCLSAGKLLGHVRLFCNPRALQPTRLLCPRDFPGKRTAVGCLFPLQQTLHLMHT